MNYRHIYHAGNFADVVKHCILIALLTQLLKKEKPFCYIDTHAGLGQYDLYSLPAQKTLEYSSGISRLLDYPNIEYPDQVTLYLNIIKKINQGKVDGTNIRFYPGSPAIARYLLRHQDRMLLMELHQEDILPLQRLFTQDTLVAVHHYDGYLGLKAFLPPKQRRGMVLIDPPFEAKNEFELVLQGIEIALSRWPTGIYAIWYPLKDLAAVACFLRHFKQLGARYLVGEMTITEQTPLKEFIGCGMIVINPPWQFEVELQTLLSWLWQVLSPEYRGGVKVYH